VVVVGAFVEKDRWLNSTTSQDVGTRAVRRPRRRRKFVGAAADFCWSAPTPCRVAADFLGPAARRSCRPKLTGARL